MKRRDFLKALGLGAAAVTFGPALATASKALPGATGDAVATDGWSAVEEADLAVGDVFTIAGRYAVNPITRRATTHLQSFVVTAIGPGAAVGVHPYHPEVGSTVNPAIIQPTGARP